ncbi:hypothetical protein Tco_0933174 [Tanacetum coccineum]
MFHVRSENNEFEDEIIPCSDFRLAHPNLADDMLSYKACTECARWVFCSCTEGPESVFQFVPTQEFDFATVFKDFFLTTIRFIQLATCFVVIRGGETMGNSIFKHDLCELVIAKMCSMITDDGTRGTKSGKESFKKFANYSGVVGKRIGIKDLFAVRFARDAPGGSIVASFETVESLFHAHHRGSFDPQQISVQEGVS